MGASNFGHYYLWLGLFLLGCYHGVNPGMGWLFAVALGLQDRSTAAVLRAIVPLALGHFVSVAVVVTIAVAAVAAFPHALVRDVAASILLAFGAYRLIRARHPRWVGVRVGFWGLALWGFLMSAAHGAGLMLLPFVTAASSVAHRMAMPMPAAPAHETVATGALMVIVHTAGYLAAMTAVALVVYRWVGVSFLRRAWVNVDVIWGVALILSGIVAFMT